ncbi:PRC-barrel domain-containing protein [Tianweitania sp. BSSL-BM11]|uniref:PRC-barrel domain-containing protein n=1 Tax=Tianweitania aestuarii TaxID=2814886 RepID=A0ABS5RZP2_9HYPH|nr:PRC-barrel domain-containing protein [Tianweitania aestuarii]MBS9722520.1 PRC-barrel domain-containing protein [Tianweitania aestuarii]
MIRKLLATTAIASVIATGAFAQTATTPAPADAPATTNAPAATAPAAGETNAPMEAAVVPADGQLASNLIGETVYNGTGDDAENIGNVNDLVLSDSGQIESVIVGVGGFLGIGEKNVALSYNDIDWAEKDGDRWIVVPTTSDALKELPAFDRRAYEPANTNAANNGGTAMPATTGTDSSMAPAAGTATTGMAAAPAAGGTAAAPAMNDTAAAPAATNDTAANNTAAADRATMTEVPAEELTAENLEGTTVYGAEDANVGDIGDVVLTKDGKVDAIIIDVGGFLGIGEKPVAVAMDDLKFMQDEDGDRYLYTTFTKEQLEAQPEYNADTWDAERDQQRMTTTQ